MSVVLFNVLLLNIVVNLLYFIYFRCALSYVKTSPPLILDWTKFGQSILRKFTTFGFGSAAPAKPR